MENLGGKYTQTKENLSLLLTLQWFPFMWIMNVIKCACNKFMGTIMINRNGKTYKINAGIFSLGGEEKNTLHQKK